MAYLNPTLRFRPRRAASDLMQFQRGLEKTPVKKIQRKLVVKNWHILLFFLLLGGSLYMFFRLYLFLINCDYLMVQKVQISCHREAVALELEPIVRGADFGNILLLNLAGIQQRIRGHRWVNEVRVRKVFPSSLKIEIKERVPAAILKKADVFYLIDEEGIFLERIDSRIDADLPVLVDFSDFRRYYHEKLELAWDCLMSLPSEERSLVESVDLSAMDSLTLTLKEEPTKIILGNSHFAEKFAFFRHSRDWLESHHGPLEYVDLRFEDRIYLKPLPFSAESGLRNSTKEIK